MPTTDVRAAVRLAVLTAVAAHPTLAGVQTQLGNPGDNLKRESVWLGDTTGTVTVPVFKAGRKTVNDEFHIDCWVLAAAAGQKFEAAEARASELVGAVEDVFLDDASLRALCAQHGIWNAVYTKNGPLPTATREGAAVFYHLELTIEVRQQE